MVKSRSGIGMLFRPIECIGMLFRPIECIGMLARECRGHVIRCGTGIIVSLLTHILNDLEDMSRTYNFRAISIKLAVQKMFTSKTTTRMTMMSNKTTDRCETVCCFGKLMSDAVQVGDCDTGTYT